MVAIPRFFLIGTAAVFVVLGAVVLISKKPKAEEIEVVEPIVLAPKVEAKAC